MTRGFFERLFSRIPRAPDEHDEERRRELAQCRFFIDGVQRLDDGAVGLRGLVGRGRLYVDEPLELVGYGERAEVRCRDIWMGQTRHEYAWKQTHFTPFAVRIEHDTPGIFRAGQVLAAAGTAHNVLACEATLEMTSTPGNLGRPLAQGSAATLGFREAEVGAEVTLPGGREKAPPGETVRAELRLTEALPLEVGDEIRLSSLGHVFARGQVDGIARPPA